MLLTETVTYLEMTSLAELRPARPAPPPFRVRRSEVPCPELSRFFYTAVGGPWRWTDRLGWTYEQWLDWVSRPGYECWLADVAGTPARYFELQGSAGEDVELGFFGLLPQFTECGLGGAFLERAVRRAWEKGARRLWLHTSLLDHPSALKNYLARGFRISHTETALAEKPEQPVGPWPGSAANEQHAAKARELTRSFQRPAPQPAAGPAPAKRFDLPAGYAFREGFNNMDFSRVHAWLAATYWTPGIGRETVERAARHSALVIGVFADDGSQAAFARIVSDKTRFAYVCDVIVDEAHRGRGLGRAMTQFALDHPELAGVRTWALATHDAQGVYAPLGFLSVTEPASRPADWMIKRRRACIPG